MDNEEKEEYPGEFKDNLIKVQEVVLIFLLCHLQKKVYREATK